MPDDATLVQTKPAQRIPAIEANRAVSILLPFEAARKYIEGRPSPKRPNRNKPIQSQSSNDLTAALALAIATPPVDVLRTLAAGNPPAEEFFDGDIERPW